MNIKTIYYFMVVLMLISSCRNDLPRMVTPGEMKMKSAWTSIHLQNTDGSIPFSFLYNGQVSSEFLQNW